MGHFRPIRLRKLNISKSNKLLKPFLSKYVFSRKNNQYERKIQKYTIWFLGRFARFMDSIQMLLVTSLQLYTVVHSDNKFLVKIVRYGFLQFEASLKFLQKIILYCKY